MKIYPAKLNSLPADLYSDDTAHRCGFCGCSFNTFYTYKGAKFCSDTCSVANNHAERARIDFEYWANKLGKT